MNNGNEELWNFYTLAPDNPDPGGGILYAVRYDTLSLYTHRDRVVDSLIEQGCSIFFTEDGLLILSIDGVSEDKEESVLLLIEELSVVNEALEFHEEGLNPDSIDGLAESLKASFARDIVSRDPSIKAAALNLVDLFIPQVVEDIHEAQAQNRVLTPAQQQKINELGYFASLKSDLFSVQRMMLQDGTFSDSYFN